MRRHSEIWTVAGLVRRHPSINPQPPYQRGPVWTPSQKQLLVDSVLRDLDIPKLYLREMPSPDAWMYEVIDGQQRMRALCEFRADAFPLAGDCDAVAGFDIAGKRYGELPDDVQDRFDQYELHFVILREARQIEVEEMFLRLQNGTTLKAAERRNAIPGRMTEFVRDLTAHPFFARLPFENQRLCHDELAAQMTLLELEGGPAEARGRNLEKMYADHREFDAAGPAARKIRRTLSFLARAFPEQAGELRKTTALSLYLLASRMIDTLAVDGAEAAFGEAARTVLRRQDEDEARPEDLRDARSLAYQEACTRRTTAEESIRTRHEHLAAAVLAELPDLERFDRRWSFSPEQKLAVWLLNDGRCRAGRRCGGRRCPSDRFEVEPVVAFAAGGRASVSNGRLACADCARSELARAS